MIDHIRLARLILTTAYSDSKLARLHGCSRSTVTRYREICLEQNLGLGDLERLGDAGLRQRFDRRTGTQGHRFIEPDWEEVALKLRRRFTLLELHAGYVERCTPDQAMSYREFCRRHSAFAHASNPIMRQVHFAGEKTMLDFAGYTPMVRLAAEAKPVRAQLFLAVLPASDYSFAIIVPSQKSADWIFANEAALRFFGGVTEFQVLDNLKAGVMAHRRGSAPSINPVYQAFCDHYGPTPAPTAPYSPTHKAKVEIAVKLVQRLYRVAFHDRPIPTLREANIRLAGIVAVVNAKPLRRLPGLTRRSLFEALDRPALCPLRTELFALTEVRPHLKVPPDYHLTHQHRCYSVPHRLIGRFVDLKISHGAVEVFHDGRSIAVHPRLAVAGTRSTDPNHMPPNHLAQRIVTEPDMRRWSEGYGPAVREAVERILATHLSGAALTGSARSLRKLGLRVGPVRLEAAAVRAIAMGDVTANRLRSILDGRLEHADHIGLLGAAQNPATHENVRGATYFQEL